MSDTLASGSPTATHSNRAGLNSPARVLFASLVGTTIEFFDFYVYATAAVLVFPTLFFPNNDPTTALLASFATFSIAFFARPLGAIVFGHYGDRIGRKTTLVAALLTMGISTVIIGLLPSYETIGVLAPLLLALCRFGQGFGLGGEWGGAVLLATENAPPGKRSWYGMFPQLGAPVGLFLSSGVFWLLLHVMSQETLLAWGWRIPFIASIVLIAVGLWVRLSITETPAFQKAIEKQERVEVPVVELFRNHKRSLFLGTFVALATFVLFYIGSAYLLSYNVKVLGIPFVEALEVQLLGSVLFAGMSGSATGVIIVSGNEQSGVPGTALAQPLVVQVNDASGNPVAGAPVTWVVTGGGGTLDPATSTTDATGRASSVWSESWSSTSDMRISSGRLITSPSAPRSLCSQISVTLCEKFGSASDGIATRS